MREDEAIEVQKTVTLGDAEGIYRVVRALLGGRIGELMKTPVSGGGLTKPGLLLAVIQAFLRDVPPEAKGLDAVLEKWIEDTGGEAALLDMFKELEIEGTTSKEEAARRVDEYRQSGPRNPQWFRRQILLETLRLQKRLEAGDAPGATLCAMGLMGLRAGMVYIEELENIVWQAHTAWGMRSILEVWEQNKRNANEEFWQKLLIQNSAILSQVLHSPVLWILGKAYLGGKGVENQGGQLGDFVAASDYTRNVTLLEIKTPATRLLGAEYRSGVYGPSPELAGALVQVANYKQTLLESIPGLNYNAQLREDSKLIFPVDPPRVIIAGCLETEVTNEQQKRSFELFRMSLKDTRILTYDELFGTVKQFVELLRGEE